jgi:hypothetical protein
MPLLTIKQGPLILACMDDASESVEGPTLDGHPVAEIVLLPRALQATVIDRGARLRTLEWKVKKAPAPDPIQALAAAVTSELALEASAGSPLVLCYGGPTGITLSFTDGALTHTVAHQGRTSLHTYRLSAGQLALLSYAPFSVIAGVTPPGATVRVVTTGASFWLQLLDSTTSVWTTVWLVNRVFTTGATTPAGTIAARVNGGFLQLADSATGGFRSLWWEDRVLQVGPVDISPADGQPASAFRLKTSSTGLFAQLIDQSVPGPQFRSLLLSNSTTQSGPLES